MSAISARMIIEVMGRPSEHVTSTLNMLIERLGKEKGVKITSSKVHQPVPVEGSKDLFTTFSEIEAEFESFNMYIAVIFGYMPSNIEIISPSTFKMTNDEMSSMGNMLIGQLHTYEALTKRLISDRDVLMNQIKKLTGKESPMPRIDPTEAGIVDESKK